MYLWQQPAIVNIVGFNPKATDKPVDYVVGLFKYMSAKKISATDKIPAQIDENVFLGSIGAAMNKAGLLSLKITHVLTVAEGINPPHPKVAKLQGL